MSEYDNVMHQVVNLPKGTINYLSPQIQNELIHCLGEHLKRQLINKINSVPYFSVRPECSWYCRRNCRINQAT